MVYSNTFSASFHLDDHHTIETNAVIKDLGYFIDPSRAEGALGHQYPTFKNRFIAYLTYALNYRAHGLDVTGYHVVNITVHLLNALLVYLLTALTLRTPRLEGSALSGKGGQIALLTAMLFVSHPLQTQAVTYIVQRSAALATTFYLASIIAYARSRLSGRQGARYALCLISIIFAALAMKTKEMSFTLPLSAALYELLFFTGPAKKRASCLLPLSLTMLIIPLTLLNLGRPVGEMLGDIGEISRSYSALPRLDYFLTELRVVVTYFRLLALPVNQNLFYDYPVYRSFLEPGLVFSFLFLASLLTLGLYLLRRSRRRPELRLVTFGILWFFLTLSVESSVIPIWHVIFEHRAYLPSVGVFMALSAGSFLALATIQGERARRGALALLIFLPLVLGLAAYERNRTWKSETTLWEDVVGKAPNRGFGRHNLGAAYRLSGRYGEAIEQYQRALSLNPNITETYHGLGLAYWSRGLYKDAIKTFTLYLQFRPDHPETYYALGVLFFTKGELDPAAENFQRAIRLRPGFAEAHNSLGSVYGTRGLTGKAIGHFQEAIRLSPGHADAHKNLGLAYLTEGRLEEAIGALRISIQYDPDNLEPHFTLGLAYERKGLLEEAASEYRKALALDPNFHPARRNLETVAGKLRRQPD
jgi:tetratricopeptide (TPR) repeat protein